MFLIRKLAGTFSVLGGLWESVTVTSGVVFNSMFGGADRRASWLRERAPGLTLSPCSWPPPLLTAFIYWAEQGSATSCAEQALAGHHCADMTHTLTAPGLGGQATSSASCY